MAEYKIQDTTLRGIADAIRKVTGGVEGIKPENMAVKIQEGFQNAGNGENLDDEIAAQDDLITEIQKALVGKTVGGVSGASFNIHYGETAPEDTSMLWCKCEEPSSVVAKARVDGADTVRLASTVFPEDISTMASGLVGTKMYFFGGQTGSSGSPTKSIRLLNTETEELTTLNVTLPSKLFDIASAVVGTKVYLFGGRTSNNTGNSINNIYVFDTETETLTGINAYLQTKSYGIASAVVGTKVYLFGGFDNSDRPIVTIDMFDTETSTMYRIDETLPITYHSYAVEAVGTKIYLFGGLDGNSTFSDLINVFDTETWKIGTVNALLPKKMYAMGTCVIGTKVYLFGGWNGVRLDSISVFDVETGNTFTLNSTLQMPRSTMSVGVVGTKVYLCGGNTNSGRTRIIEVFSIQAELPENHLYLQSTLTENIFNIIPGIEIGVKNVYRGNSEGTGELVESYLHNGEEWVRI